MKTTACLAIGFLLVTTTAGCSDDDAPGEPTGTTSSAQKCPSPMSDRDGFVACVKGKNGKAGNGNGGTASESNNGGSIRLGDIDAKKGSCSNLSIRCDGDGCTCSSNGGPMKACEGTDCASICCGP